MLTTNGFALYKTNWLAPITMIFGSFIAGASSEGGGAVAFPVFTLLMNIPPDTARNFSFAIQSIGMTAASTLIIGLKIPISWHAIRYTTFSGALGLVLGSFYLAPYVPPAEMKLIFVSIWLSFGFALYLINKRQNRVVVNELQLKNNKDKALILVFSFIGGLITSIFGNGIDIFTFCLFTLYFNLNEKIATPTSVVIMTINTILGFFLHLVIIRDFQPQALNFWLCSIPVVLIFAPLGAYFVSQISRIAIASLLYLIITVQYIGAIFVIKPNTVQLLVSTSIVLLGFTFFWKIAHLKNN